MKKVDITIQRRMLVFLWFLAFALPFYLFGLHFYFSSKAALLSSAIAAGFGGGILRGARHRPEWHANLTLLAPFIFVGTFYLFCPSMIGLLYALTATSLCICLWSQRRLSAGTYSGGRGEMTAYLQSAAAPHLLVHFEQLFVSWSAASLAVVVLFAIVGSQWVAFVSLLSFAVVLSSMVNFGNSKEPK
ncbi:hypothetical protein EBR21_01370 [bacterium]|nr:hypothetical protein [bacterium]